ncbi:hypothetical protein [Neptuniibacter halophilus]|uniref:hypothetical protein n=1 Tax=Neptuniibacter halophilus TaxID=651666 RepID=UPI0025748799|nr:hypothetical protein [Neptuniibacter halophilus]
MTDEFMPQEYQGEFLTQADAQRAIIDMEKAKQIAEKLWKHYPGHLWAVHADTVNNVATVQLLGVSGQWGFYLHLDKLDPGLRKVMQAGGEILERFNLHRGQRRDDEYAGLVRDFAGRVQHAE